MSIVPPDPNSLATVADFTARFPALSQGFDPIIIAETLVEATDHIESTTSRRIAPFSGHTYEDRLRGLDPQEYGQATPNVPMPWGGSIGMSYSNALGADGLVRHFWLDQFAPFHPELWTYDVQTIELELTYGNLQQVPLSGVRGPAVTDGHCWLPIGTFAPIGTRVIVTYGGGYTVSIPPALKRACLYQAVKFLTIDAEPQVREGLNMNELDAQLVSILASWARG